MPSRRVLLLGFEPFERFRVNSSWEAIRDWEGHEFAGAELAARRLPVSYAGAAPALAAHLAATSPELVLAFGLHPGHDIRLERIALNVDHTGARRRDNDGLAVLERPIDPTGPLALASPLALDDARERLEAAGLRARLSFHAGTYLCNHVYYRLLRDGWRAGFIHVPPLWSVRHVRGWPLGRLRRAVREVLGAVLGRADRGTALRGAGMLEPPQRG